MGREVRANASIIRPGPSPRSRASAWRTACHDNRCSKRASRTSSVRHSSRRSRVAYRTARTWSLHARSRVAASAVAAHRACILAESGPSAETPPAAARDGAATNASADASTARMAACADRSTPRSRCNTRVASAVSSTRSSPRCCSTDGRTRATAVAVSAAPPARTAGRWSSSSCRAPADHTATASVTTVCGCHVPGGRSPRRRGGQLTRVRSEVDRAQPDRHAVGAPRTRCAAPKPAARPGPGWRPSSAARGHQSPSWRVRRAKAPAATAQRAARRWPRPMPPGPPHPRPGPPRPPRLWAARAPSSRGHVSDMAACTGRLRGPHGERARLAAP